MSPLLKSLIILRAQQLGIIAFFLLIFEFITLMEWVRPTTIPFMHKIFPAFWNSILSGEVLPHLGASLYRLLLSVTFATIISVPTGLLLWRIPLLGKAMEPIFASLYGMPWIFFYPVFIIMLGLGNTPIVVLGVLYGSIPIVLNTFLGFTQVRPIYMKVAQSTQASGWRTFWQIQAPAAAPFLVSGMKIGFIYSFLAVITSELLTSPTGLGFLVYYNYYYFNTTEMYGNVLFLIVTGFTLVFLLNRLERALRGRFE